MLLWLRKIQKDKDAGKLALVKKGWESEQLVELQTFLQLQEATPSECVWEGRAKNNSRLIDGTMRDTFQP
jgi:hypothetical protein